MFKKILNFFIVILVIWLIVFIINIFRCINYKEPIFYIYTIEDEYTASYKCLFYTIDTTKRSKGIIKTKMTFLKVKLFETQILEERVQYIEIDGVKHMY